MNDQRKQQLLEFFHSLAINTPDDDALTLYDRALTHSSYAKEQADRGIKSPDNEKLEFLGNFVLDLIVSEYLYERHESEGEMSKKMAVTGNEYLPGIMERMGIDLGCFLLHSTGVALTDSMVSDTFEAFVGAVYLDRGLDRAREIVLGILQDEIDAFDPEMLNPISSLSSSE